MASKVRYAEGDVFAVPLEGDRGYGIGVVARATKKGPTLGYFFGPRRDEVPGLSDVGDLNAVDNVWSRSSATLG